MGLFDNFPTLVTTIAWAIVALIAIFVYISSGNLTRGRQGLMTSLLNVMSFSTLNAAIICLIVVKRYTIVYYRLLNSRLIHEK